MGNPLATGICRLPDLFRQAFKFSLRLRVAGCKQEVADVIRPCFKGLTSGVGG